MTEPMLIGMTFMNRNAFLRERCGPEALKQVLAKLPKATADILRMPVASEWYPMSRLVEIDKAICQLFLGNDETRIKELGRFNLEKQVTGVYRFLFRFLDPVFAIKKSGELWTKLVDQGMIRVEQDSERRMKLRIVDFEPTDETFCCALRGSFEGVMVSCGAKDVVVEHPECTRRGAKELLFTLTWKS